MAAADQTCWESFFSENPQPKSLPDVRQRLEAFCSLHDGHRIVLVTSGGTTVPLERNTVRFIDNFSAGTRGSASAENFAKQGYAVIFLHRLGLFFRVYLV